MDANYIEQLMDVVFCFCSGGHSDVVDRTRAGFFDHKMEDKYAKYVI